MKPELHYELEKEIARMRAAEDAFVENNKSTLDDELRAIRARRKSSRNKKRVPFYIGDLLTGIAITTLIGIWVSLAVWLAYVIFNQQ